MKKLLLFLMATVLCAAPSCTNQDDLYDVEIPDTSNPTVTLVGLTDSDTGVFVSRDFEPQNFFVDVDANMTLYPDATGNDLKSYGSSSENFTVEFDNSNAILTVTPIATNYTDEDITGVLSVTLNNNIGAGTASIELSHSKPTYTTMTFEADQTISKSGSAVAVDSYSMVYYDFSTSGTYEQTYSSLYMAGEAYDDVLFQSADSRIQFGQYFVPSSGYGDYWAGFALCGEHSDDETAACDYVNQFTAWGDESGSFAVAYYSDYYGGEYEAPAIIFSEPTTVSSLKLTNTLYTHQYTKTNLSSDTDLYLEVVLTPSLNGETFLDEYDELLEYREYLIADDTTTMSVWTMIEDMQEIGDIDRIDITFESNDYYVYSGVKSINAPIYVAIDDIKYVSEW